jgi:23S rRNA pseudouridine2605 synthase
VRQRIQKLLSARGIGSRRRVEDWIASGRITVNGKPATPGQPVAETDDIRLDGRRLRLWRRAHEQHKAVAYHRPAGEDLRPKASAVAASSIERLPRPAGGRWVPVSPLPPQDGGLEVFVTDGALAAALTRRSLAIESEFSVRVRGDFDEATLEARVSECARGTPAEGRIAGISAAGGEGTNRWLQVRTTGLRPRDLWQLLHACGLDPNRLLRTRYGPVAMDRSLARGRSRALTEPELQQLHKAAGLPITGSRTPRR